MNLIQEKLQNEDYKNLLAATMGTTKYRIDQYFTRKINFSTKEKITEAVNKMEGRIPEGLEEKRAYTIFDLFITKGTEVSKNEPAC